MPDDPPFPTVEDYEEEEEDTPPGVPAVEEPVKPEDAPARVLHGRPRGPSKKGKAGAGFSGVPGKNPGDWRGKRSWESREADFMWDEMVAELRNKGCSPHDIDVRVIRMDPPPQHTLPNAINGGAVAGSSSETPGEMLAKVVDDNYHLPTSRVPATYDILFMWKSTSTYWGRGRLCRPHPEEILAIRQAMLRNRQASPPPAPGAYVQPIGMGAPGYPQAPPGTPGAQVYGQQPPQGYGYPSPPYYPPQPAAPAPDPARDQLINHLIAQNQAMFEWAKKQGMQPPAGLAAPPPQAPSPPVYAPAPPPAPAAGFGLPDDIERAVSMIERLRHAGDRINGVFGRTVVEPGASPVVAEPEEPEPEKPTLSFDVLAIPETTLKMAKDRETGNIDWGNTALVNLDSEIGHKIVGLAGDFLKGVVKAAGVKSDGTVIPGGQRPQLPANGAANGVGVAGPPTGWKP